MHNEPPARIGRYDVLQRLARGGMAEVFLAETRDVPGVRRVVVLKRLLPELAGDPAFARMFLDEARLMATLNHPNVVHIVEVGAEGDQLFIAMEHIRGEALATLARTKLPLDLALQIVTGILAGLDYVHERRGDDGRPLRLVHRDVSPANVLVTYDGMVKLIDFGIAKQSNRLGATRTGRVKGTVPYMSPEQCRGRLVDRRSDLFSTGILLWELLVGRRLYDGASEFDVFKQIVEDDVPRPSVDGVPDALDPIVARALAKEPAARYQSAADMLADLEACARALGLSLSPRNLHAYMRASFAKEAEAWQAFATAVGDARQKLLTQVTKSADHPSRARRWPFAIAFTLAAAGGAAYVLWPAPMTTLTDRTTSDLARPLADLAIADLAPVAPVAPVVAPTRTPKRAPTGEGTLVLDAKPWCQVYVDGESRGPTPLELRLPAGPHVIELRNEEFHIARKVTLRVEPNKALRRRFEFPVAKSPPPP